MPEVHELVVGPVTCHCWNGDRTSERTVFLDFYISHISSFHTLFPSNYRSPMFPKEFISLSLLAILSLPLKCMSLFHFLSNHLYFPYPTFVPPLLSPEK